MISSIVFFFSKLTSFNPNQNLPLDALAAAVDLHDEHRQNPTDQAGAHNHLHDQVRRPGRRHSSTPNRAAERHVAHHRAPHPGGADCRLTIPSRVNVV